MSLNLWPQTFWGQVGLAGGLLVAAIALWRGPTRDRIAAVGILANLVFTVILQDRHTWKDSQHASLWIDGALMALLVGETIAYRKAWLGVSASAQILTTLTHVSIGLQVNALIGPRAYHTASITMTFVMLLAVLLDTVSGSRSE